MANNNKRLAKELDKEENSKEFKPSGRRRSRKGDSLKSKGNDVSWYATDPSIIRDAGSFPFSRPAGSLAGWNFQYNERQQGTTADIHDFADSSFYGIYKLDVIPTIGYSTDKTSPINVAATALYSFIRHANSGHANYDAPDLMMYLLSVSQIYSCINWGQRIYGTMLMFSQRNRFIPRYLLQSDGIDVDDFAANLANFRYGLNLAINKISALAVPNSLSLFNRMAFLFQNYYIEGPSIKDQIYYLSPNSFSKYTVSSISNRGELRLAPMNRTLGSWKVSQYLTYLNDLIDALLAEEDIGIMSGDILKAYGENIIKLKSMDEVYALTFVQDEMFMSQIKNSTPLVTPYVTMTGMGDIGQDNSGNIVAKPYLNYSTSADGSLQKAVEDILGTNALITFDKQDVTPEDVIEGTRLHCSVRNITDSGTTRPYVFTGTEIPLTAHMYRINRKSTLNAALQEVRLPYVMWMDTGTSSALLTAIANLTSASNFKYHSACYPVWSTSSGALWNGNSPAFDVDNYAMLSATEVERLHEACILNMVHVPAIAKAYQG